MSHIKGFTLIETLMVIAIIGILASVVMTPLMNARVSAQDAKTLSSLKSVQQIATYCIDTNSNLNTPNIANQICAGQDTWPAPVGDGWVYGDFGACVFDGNVADGTFTYCAHNGVTVIACNESTCTKT